MLRINSNSDIYIKKYSPDNTKNNEDSKTTKDNKQENTTIENNKTTNYYSDISNDVIIANKGIVVNTAADKTSQKAEVVKTDANGNTLIYKDGKLYKKIYANNSYRIYERDTEGNLLSSKTYRADDSLYSTETYGKDTNKLFNDKSRKLYETRTFYDKQGNEKETKTFKYKDLGNGTISKTITSNKSNDVNCVIMDKNKKVLGQVYETRDKNNNLIRIENYNKDGKIESATNYKDNVPVMLETNKYNADGSLTVKYTYYENKNGKNYATGSETLEYGKDGKITSRDIYTYYKNGNNKTLTKEIYDEDHNVSETTKLSYDKSGKITSKELDSDADGTIDKTYEYTYGDNGKITQTKVTTAKNNVYYYEKGKLIRAEFANGRERIYEHDEKGNLTSSTTYRKDGSVYSKETYGQANKLFNNLNTKLYETRTFYDKNGNKIQTKTYNYKENSNGDIVKTVTSDSNNKTTVVTMDKDKNVKSKSIVIKNDNNKIIDMESYENGILKTTIKQSTDDNGNSILKKEYYKYNEDGSKTVISASYSIAEDGTIKRNDGSIDSILEYDANGKLKSKTVYSGYINSDYNPNGNEMDIAIRYNKSKIVYEYDENGNEINITKEVYSNYNNGKRDVKVYNGTRDKNTGKITYIEDQSKARTEDTRQNHNLTNVTGNDIVAKAKKYLGYNNKDGNQFLFGTDVEWCCEFATYVCLELGIDLTSVKTRNWGKNVMDLAVQEGRFTDASTAASASTKQEQKQMSKNLIGQIILFGNDETVDGTTTTTYKHTGLVEKVEYNDDGTMTVYTVEGNTGKQATQKKYIVDKNGNIIKNCRYDGSSWTSINHGNTRIIGFADFISK